MEGQSAVPMVSAVSWEWHLCEILRVFTNNTSKPIEHLQNIDQKTFFPTGNAIFWFQSVSQNWGQARACQDAEAAQHRNTGAPRCLGKQALRRHKGVATRGQRIHQQLIAESRASAVVPQIQNRHPGVPVFLQQTLDREDSPKKIIVVLGGWDLVTWLKGCGSSRGLHVSKKLGWCQVPSRKA